MTIENVALQLQTHCPCFTDVDEQELVTVAKELVDLISLSTCWTTESCETLLKSVRTETVEIPCYDCRNCCGDYFTFQPYFQYGIEEDSIKLTVTSLNGLKMEQVEVDEEDFALLNFKGYNEIKFNLRPYSKPCQCKTCEVLYLTIEYVAGYEELPECLFPEVCDIVKTITASKIGCGSLDDCCNMTPEELGYRLASKKKGELSWSWTLDEQSTAYIYRQLLNANRFKSLGMISLCDRQPDDLDTGIWAVVSH